MGALQKWMLALDPTARTKFENELKDTGRRGGDNLSSEMEKGTGRLDATFKKIAGWLAAAFAVDKIKDFAVSSIRAASEAEAGWNALGITLNNQGINIEEQRGRIEALGESMLKSTRFGDDAAYAALSQMVQITGDYEKSLRAVPIAADLAAAKQIPLEQASLLVGRAINGNTTALSRMGVEIPKNGDALTILGNKFKGFAEGELNTMAGRTAQLGQYFGELQEEIGKTLISAGEGASIMDLLSGAVEGVTKWVIENRTQLVEMGTVLVKVLGVGFQVAGKAVTIFIGFLQALWNAGKIAFEGLLTGYAKLTEVAAKVADALGMDKVASALRSTSDAAKGILEDMARKGAEQAALMNKTNEEMGKNLGTSIQGGADVGSAAMQKLAEEARKTREKFQAEVQQMAYDVPKLAEEAMRALSDITVRTIDNIARASEAANRQQLTDLKNSLLQAEQTYTEHHTQVVITENMTTEQRRAAFEAAANAQEHIEAQRVVSSLERNDQYMKSQEYRDDQRVARLEENQRQIVAGTEVANNQIQADTESTNAAMSANHASHVEQRVQGIQAWAGSMTSVIDAVGQVGNAFGIMGSGVGNVLGAVMNGIGSVVSAVSNLGGALQSITQGIAGLNSGAGGLLGTIGSIAGIAGGVGAAVGIGGAVIGAIGGLFKGSKDEGRMKSNRQWAQAAMAGDAAALAKLHEMSGRTGRPGAGYGGVVGWGSKAAQDDAWALYQQVLAQRGGGAAAAPSAPAPGHSMTRATTPTGTRGVGLTNPVSRAGPGWGGNVTINQHGVTGDNVSGKTVAAVEEVMARRNQRAGILSGNSRM